MSNIIKRKRGNMEDLKLSKQLSSLGVTEKHELPHVKEQNRNLFYFEDIERKFALLHANYKLHSQNDKKSELSGT